MRDNEKMDSSSLVMQTKWDKFSACMWISIHGYVNLDYKLWIDVGKFTLLKIKINK